MSPRVPFLPLQTLCTFLTKTAPKTTRTVFPFCNWVASPLFPHFFLLITAHPISTRLWTLSVLRAPLPILSFALQ